MWGISEVMKYISDIPPMTSRVFSWTIENDVSTARFEECRRRLKTLLPDGGKEVLLFHGTDLTNIEGIFNSNFDIDLAPATRTKVVVVSVTCRAYLNSFSPGNEIRPRYLHV